MMSEAQKDYRVGEKVSEGAFLLDHKRALEKLSDFRLPSPYHYLLEFIKAAHLVDASFVAVELGGRAMKMEFDGLQWSEEELKALYSAPFLRYKNPKERALRSLSIGVVAAKNLGLMEFQIEVRRPNGLLRYCLVDEEIRDFEEVEVDSTWDWTTRISLVERRSLKHVARWLMPALGVEKQIEFLRQKCRFSRLKLAVNRELISRGHSLEEPLDFCTTFQTEFETGRMGLSFQRDDYLVHVAQEGVLIGEARLPLAAGGGEVVVESSRLTTNLSESAFVENQAWEKLTRELDRVARNAMGQFLRELENSTEVSALPRGLTSHLERMVEQIGATPESDKDLKDLMEGIAVLLGRQKAGLLDFGGESAAPNPAEVFEKVERLSDWWNSSKTWEEEQGDFLHQESWTIDATQVLTSPIQERHLQRTWRVLLGINNGSQSSKVLFFRHGRLCSVTAGPGLDIRIDGPLALEPCFRRPLESENLGRVYTKISQELPRFLRRFADSRPSLRAFDFLYFFYSGELVQKLAKAFGVGEEHFSKCQPPEGWGDQDRRSKLDDFGELRNAKIFRGIDFQFFSLQELLAHCEEKQFWGLAIGQEETPAATDLLALGCPVIAEGYRKEMAMIEQLFGISLMSPEYYHSALMSLESARDAEHSSPSLDSELDRAIEVPSKRSTSNEPGCLKEKQARVLEEMLLREERSSGSLETGIELKKRPPAAPSIGKEKLEALLESSLALGVMSAEVSKRAVDFGHHGPGVMRVTPSKLSFDAEHQALKAWDENPDDLVLRAFLLLAIESCQPEEHPRRFDSIGLLIDELT